MKKTAVRKKRPELSWTPRAIGTIYCAPACGRGCTREEYETAKAFSESMAIRLGPGWKAAPSENMGWHAKAVSSCGKVKVHTDWWRREKWKASASYTAYIGEDESAGGRWVYTDKTPGRAYAGAAAMAMLESVRITKLVASLPKASGR